MLSFRTPVRFLPPDAGRSFSLESVIEEAASVIRSDGIVAFPTETVYGLGGNAFSEKAAARIYEAKKRPPEKPLSVLIGSAADMETAVTEIPDVAFHLAEKFWPGPLTIVLNKKSSIPDSVTRGLPTIGLRVPAHPIALALVAETGPLACPSANISGNPAPRTASDVLADLDGRIDLVIDGGPASLGVSSTIIDLTKPVPTLLRAGALSPGRIRDCIGDIRVRG